MNRERCIICRSLCGGGGEAEVVVEVEIATNGHGRECDARVPE